MTFRERAVETLKVMGQSLVDKADELIPHTRNVKEVSVWLRIPSLSDDPDSIPEIQVSTDIYPSKNDLRLNQKQAQ